MILYRCRLRKKNSNKYVDNALNDRKRKEKINNKRNHSYQAKENPRCLLRFADVNIKQVEKFRIEKNK